MEGEKQVKETLKKYEIVTKVFAVFAAVVTWMYVMSDINPIQAIPYDGLKITIEGESSIYNAYNLSVIEGKDTDVSVKVSGTRNQLLLMKASEIEIKADVSYITEPGVYEVPYSIDLPLKSLTVVSNSPQKIILRVDKIVEKSIPVDVVLLGKTRADYVYESAVFSNKTVAITGPQTEVSKISNARIEIDVEKLTSTISDSFEYTLIDDSGESVQSPYIKKEVNTVSVIVPVKKVKTVPLTAKITDTNDIKEEDVTLTFSTSEVEIYGEDADLNQVTALSVANINLADVNDGDIIEYTINPPRGIYLKSNQKKTGTVLINIDTSQTSKFSISNIKLNDIALEEQKKNVSVTTETLDIVLKGTKSVLDSIINEDIEVSINIDSTKLVQGEQTLPAIIVVKRTGVTVEGVYTVDVIVEE